MPKREATAAADSLPVRSRGPVKVKLTKTGLFEAIDHCGKAERYMVWDTEVAGLMARVSPKGATLFLDYRAWDGKQSRLKLARLDKATDIDAVRKMAAAKRLEVAAGGSDVRDVVDPWVSPELAANVRFRNINSTGFLGSLDMGSGQSSGFESAFDNLGSLILGSPAQDRWTV